VFYSMYGHIYRMSEAVVEGAREVEGAEVSLYQVAELVPEEALEKIGAKAARFAFKHVPIATPAQLAEADAIIGSEQESVRPPGFIGFPRFGADGLTSFHGPGSESSPMFTHLSARSRIDRRGRRKSPLFVYADDRQGPTHQRRKRGQQLSAPTQSDCAMAYTGRSGKAKPPRRYCKITGYGCHQPGTIREFRIQGSQRLRCSQQVAASDRPLTDGILIPAIPGRAKRSTLRQLAVSPNSRAEPEMFRRSLPPDGPRPKLGRLANRLTKLIAELRALTQPGK
jgi:hypothetical protein